MRGSNSSPTYPALAFPQGPGPPPREAQSDRQEGQKRIRKADELPQHSAEGDLNEFSVSWGSREGDCRVRVDTCSVIQSDNPLIYGKIGCLCRE